MQWAENAAGVIRQLVCDVRRHNSPTPLVRNFRSALPKIFKDVTGGLLISGAVLYTPVGHARKINRFQDSGS